MTDDTGERFVYCPFCRRRILPGQDVINVDNEDPFQALAHTSCHLRSKPDLRERMLAFAAELEKDTIESGGTGVGAHFAAELRRRVDGKETT